MRQERNRYDEYNDREIVQGVCAEAPASFLVAKVIHRRSESEHMDENRALDRADIAN